MKINGYQSSYNHNFGAKFVNNTKDLDIDAQKVGTIFEKLTQDIPDETLSLDKQYAWGEGGDVFTLKDNANNKLARIACSFTTHSKMDENPETQASLLNNIFRFMRARASENASFNEITQKMNILKKQMNYLTEQEENLHNKQYQNIIKDAQKYDIEISQLNSYDPDFKRIYKTAQYMIRSTQEDSFINRIQAKHDAVKN